MKVCHHDRYEGHCGTCVLDSKSCLELAGTARVVCHHGAQGGHPWQSSCASCHVDGRNCAVIGLLQRVVCHHRQMEAACDTCYIDELYCVVLDPGWAVVCHHRKFAGYCGSCHVDGVHCKKVDVGQKVEVLWDLAGAETVGAPTEAFVGQIVLDPTEITRLKLANTLTRAHAVVSRDGRPLTLDVEIEAGYPELSGGAVVLGAPQRWSRTLDDPNTWTRSFAEDVAVAPELSSWRITASCSSQQIRVPFRFKVGAVEYPAAFTTTDFFAPKLEKLLMPVEGPNWARAAVVIVDVWDNHPWKEAADRVGELVPAIDRFIRAAREQGALIIHCPSSCADAYWDLYKDPSLSHGRYTDGERAAWRNGIDARDAHPELHARIADLSLWQQIAPDRPIDQYDGRPGDGGGAWTRQHAGIVVDGRDAFAGEDTIESGYQVLLGLLADRTDVVYVGVHTNMCILNRQVALCSLARVDGRPPLRRFLVRDLTDSMYRADEPRVDHFAGTDLIVTWITRTLGVPLITSDVLPGAADRPFRFAADRREPLRADLRGRTVRLRHRGGDGTQYLQWTARQGRLVPAAEATLLRIADSGNTDVVQLELAAAGTFASREASTSTGKDSGSFWWLQTTPGTNWAEVRLWSCWKNGNPNPGARWLRGDAASHTVDFSAIDDASSRWSFEPI